MFFKKRSIRVGEDMVVGEDIYLKGCSLIQGDLPNGGRTSVEIGVTTITEGTLTNNASASADTTEPNLVNDSNSEDHLEPARAESE